jgi:hypothetical protein
MSTLQNTPRKPALRVAMEERNKAAIVDAFGPDAVFHSPLTEKLAFRGREQIAALTDVILEVFKDFRYTEELLDENSGFLISRAQVGGIEIEMIDHMRLGAGRQDPEAHGFHAAVASSYGGAAADWRRVWSAKELGQGHAHLRPR